MNRKTYARNWAIEKQEGKTKAMSVVDAFDPSEAELFVRKMIEKESRGNGDQMNALDRVAARCGVTARQLRRFLSGEIKRPDWGFIQGIRIGWIGLWEEQIRRMQADLEIQKARFGSDHFQDLDAEAQALAAKIQARKERIRS